VDQVACAACGEDIGESISTDDGFKSCPQCSRQIGRHAFHKAPEAFGLRNNGGRLMIQSWCSHCRQEASGDSSPAFVCGG
jgi:hypothetical protein